jgi:hypothetical protein
VIDLGGFPRGIVEHPSLSFEIKINPARFEIFSWRDKSDMSPGCASVRLRMQFKLVGEEALVTVDDPHIPRGYYTLGLLDILQRFGLENDSVPLIWRG